MVIGSAGLFESKSMREPGPFYAMQAHIIAYDLPTDLMEDDRDVFNLKMCARCASVIVRVEVKMHADFQVRQRAVTFDASHLVVFAKDEEVGVLHVSYLLSCQKAKVED